MEKDKIITNRDKLKEVFSIDLNEDGDFYLTCYIKVNDTYTELVDKHTFTSEPKYKTMDISMPMNDWLNSEYKSKDEEQIMLDKETYKKELVRMWDSLRTNCKGLNNCNCVNCEKCPLSELEGCQYVGNDFERIEIVERWSKEHPKKYKVSKFEFDFLEENLKCVDGAYYLKFSEIRQLEGLLKKGYFKGATREMKVKDYFDNCKVE